MYGPCGKWLSFVFPRVQMFPLTSSQETLGLLGKQNELFHSEPYISVYYVAPGFEGNHCFK